MLRKVCLTVVQIIYCKPEMFHLYPFLPSPTTSRQRLNLRLWQMTGTGRLTVGDRIVDSALALVLQVETI